MLPFLDSRTCHRTTGAELLEEKLGLYTLLDRKAPLVVFPTGGKGATQLRIPGMKLPDLKGSSGVPLTVREHHWVGRTPSNPGSKRNASLTSPLDQTKISTC